jgi:hypothetical protein
VETLIQIDEILTLRYRFKFFEYDPGLPNPKAETPPFPKQEMKRFGSDQLGYVVVGENGNGFKKT